MSGTINFFDTYVLMAIQEEIVPAQTFFKDRYFPTGAGDIFAADKVLTEYRKGNRKMAAFVAPRAGDIPLDRRGYEIHEYQPAMVAPSRTLTTDELEKRGFGEAIYANSTPAERAARLQMQDMSDIEDTIVRREEWMAVQTMINNACDMQEFIDADTLGDVLRVQFYDTASEHTYTPSIKWDATTKFSVICGDVRTMCKMLSRRGMNATDFVLGVNVADTLLENAEFRERMKTDSNINLGSVNQTITYPGVVHMGRLNFDGNLLDIWEVDESYENDAGVDTAYFPSTSAMVTFPACGHMMYGQISQIDYGRIEFATYAAKRVPKFFCDQAHDIRKLRVAARPLAAPKQYCPYIYADKVVG